MPRFYGNLAIRFFAAPCAALACVSAFAVEEEPATPPKQALEIEAGEPRFALHIDSGKRDFGPITRASSLLGRQLVDVDGSMVGAVENVAVDLEEGRGALLTIRLQGGDKERRLAVPWSLVSDTGKALQLRVSKEKLQTAPALAAKSDSPQNRLWGSSIFEFFEVEPYWKDRTAASAWGPESTLTKQFAEGEPDAFQGVIERISYVRPTPAGTPAVHLTVRTAAGDRVVHAGPLSYFSRRNFTFNQGEKIAVKGVAVKEKGVVTIIASELKGAAGTLNLRNQDGVGVWSDWSAAADEYQFALISDLRGKSVVDDKNQTIGSIVDFALLQRDGRIAYAATRLGDQRQALHAIPLTAFVAEPASETWRLEVNKQVVENTPTFSPDQWPTKIDRAWVEYVHVRYGKSLFGGVIHEKESQREEEKKQPERR